MGIKIVVSGQLDGTTFSLSPDDRERVTKLAQDNFVPNQVYVGHSTRMSFETIHGPIWRHVAEIVTGLSGEELEAQGGVEFVDPSDRVLHRLHEAA